MSSAAWRTDDEAAELQNPVLSPWCRRDPNLRAVASFWVLNVLNLGTHHHQIIIWDVRFKNFEEYICQQTFAGYGYQQVESQVLRLIRVTLEFNLMHFLRSCTAWLTGYWFEFIFYSQLLVTSRCLSRLDWFDLSGLISVVFQRRSCWVHSIPVLFWLVAFIIHLWLLVDTTLSSQPGPIRIPGH